MKPAPGAGRPPRRPGAKPASDRAASAMSLSYDQTPGPSDDQIDNGILHEFVGLYLRTAHEAAYNDFIRRMGPEALRPGYFTILTLIVRNPRISQTQIGAASARDKSTVTNALRWMEDEGLITRVKSAHDRRAHLSVATAEGVALQGRIEQKAHAHIAALHDAIGTQEYGPFIATLKRMTERLNATAQAQAASDTAPGAETGPRGAGTV